MWVLPPVRFQRLESSIMVRTIFLVLFGVVFCAVAQGQFASTGKMKIDAGGNVSSDGKIRERVSPAEEAKEFLVADGFAIELVASEPDLINPVALAVDDKGRMIVSESHTYRYGKNGSPVNPYKNPVVRLEPKADKSGYDRVVLADGFDDPVMGIALRDGKMWVTANNYLYRFDLPESGPAENKTTLVVDKNKAWNPFGMFVLEFGPDGLLYLSVGDHKIELIGPKNADGSANVVTSRGTSGVVVRMNSDGTNMQRLTQGFRVPYSFEFDPFGQLWLLSNGEGNPNRFARIIPGVDYHCYTRKVDNNWLGGRDPLAPPVFELLRGAHTQLMRYYGAAFPSEYQGNLFLDNWGSHGFHGPNRGIFRYVPDDRGAIVKKEVFVSCNDPHFRPAHIALDNDGNMLIADWYGKDDESDLTGRIWRVRFTGSSPRPAEPTEGGPLAELGSPSHVRREAAVRKAAAAGDLAALAKVAASSNNALAAANALWALRRIDTPAARQQTVAGFANPDPRVRILAIDLARQQPSDALKAALPKLLQDADPAVRLQAAITIGTADALFGVLAGEVLTDPHLRYEAAAHFAKVADAKQFRRLITSDDPNARLAGWIALDVALYERTPASEQAVAMLSDVLMDPKSTELESAVTLVQQHANKAMLPMIDRFLTRADIPAAPRGKAILTYRAIAGKLPKAAGKAFLEGTLNGHIAIKDVNDHRALLELIESEGPTPLAVELLDREIRVAPSNVKPEALALARRFGPKSAVAVKSLWPSILDEKAKSPDLDALATVAVIESPPTVENWVRLLDSSDPVMRTDAVRWFRAFKKNPEQTKTLLERTPGLLKVDPNLADDLATVFRELGVASSAVPKDDGRRDRAELTKFTAAALDGLSQGELPARVVLGKQVFERALCTKCHTTVTQNTPLAPSLKGVGTQKIDYLIESILEPSKIIKTGFETEVIVTTAGKTLSGLVKDEGTHLRVQNFDLDVRVPKQDVEERTVQKRSIMPENQETQLSRREFVDLIAYLSTLK